MSKKPYTGARVKKPHTGMGAEKPYTPGHSKKPYTGWLPGCGRRPAPTPRLAGTSAAAGPGHCALAMRIGALAP